MQKQALAAILAFGAGAFSACDKGAEGYYGTVKPKHASDVLWINNSGEPEYIDPGKCSDSTGGTVILNIFAGLTQPHPKTLVPMPDVARRWDVSEDGKVYTFHLRHDSKWSDGTPLTAHDFEWSWKRVLDAATASKYANFLWVLENAEAFTRGAVWVSGFAADEGAKQLEALLDGVEEVERVEPARSLGGFLVYLTGSEQDAARKKLLTMLDGKTIGDATLSARTADASMVGVRARDGYTLEVRLNDALPYFLSIANFYTTMPVPRHVIERLEREGQNTDLWTRPENIVSNGAYKLVDWEFRQKVRLEKNPHYWDAKNVRTPTIILSMVESYNTALNLYEAGESDWIGENTSLPAEFMNHLRTFADFHTADYLASYFYWFNTAKPPLDDFRVRRALSLAVDRESLVKYVARGGQTPSSTLSPDGVAGYKTPDSPLFDPEKARQFLAEAGYPGGKGFPGASVIYNTSEGHKQIAEAIQQMWKEHLGIHVAIENQEWKVFLKNLQLYNFQISRMGWIGDYADPFTFLEILSSGSGNNHSNWKDPKYDAMLREANAMSDRDARLAHLQKAEAYALSQQPLLPIYIYTRSQVWKPYIKGIWTNPQDRHPFKYIWIDERWYDGVPKDDFEEPVPPMVPME